MHPKENTLKEEFKMTKFEIIGSEFQKEAASEREAREHTQWQWKLSAS
jgi:hypothetical protein